MTGTQSRRTCTVCLFDWQHAISKMAFGGVADAPEVGRHPVSVSRQPVNDLL